MNETLQLRLLKAAEVLHWLDKHDEANSLIILKRLCDGLTRKLGRDVEVSDLEKMVSDLEKIPEAQ